MVKFLSAVISKNAPKYKNVMWIKPLDSGGVALYVLYSGKWQRLKLVTGTDDPSVVVNGNTGDSVINAGETVVNTNDLVTAGLFNVVGNTMIQGDESYKGTITSALELPDSPTDGDYYLAIKAFRLGETQVKPSDKIVWDDTNSEWEVETADEENS